MAEKLGYTVSELQSRMSARELTYWMALWKLRHKEEQKAAKQRELQQRASAATRPGPPQIRRGR